jgi:hypothetical protein
MKVVIAQFELNIPPDNETHGNTCGKAESINKRIQLSFQKVADTDLRIILNHREPGNFKGKFIAKHNTRTKKLQCIPE